MVGLEWIRQKCKQFRSGSRQPTSERERMNSASVVAKTDDANDDSFVSRAEYTRDNRHPLV